MFPLDFVGSDRWCEAVDTGVLIGLAVRRGRLNVTVLVRCSTARRSRKSDGVYWSQTNAVWTRRGLGGASRAC